MPEGSLQLLCGSPEGLLDQLGAQDSVAFTGSASTGATLRQHPSVLHGGAQLGVEADSLNCSILGPDVTPDDPEFDLYVKGVVAEMTVKAGQKCTAIRRTIVPAAIADEVIAAISARLAKVTVGNPANPDVRMGALASLAQRDEVRKAVQILRGVGRDRVRRPRPRGRRRRRRRGRRVHVADPAARRPPAPPSPTRSRRSARSAPSSRTTRSTRRSPSPPAGRAASSARSSPTIPPSPAP